MRVKDKILIWFDKSQSYHFCVFAKHHTCTLQLVETSQVWFTVLVLYSESNFFCQSVSDSECICQGNPFDVNYTYSFIYFLECSIVQSVISERALFHEKKKICLQQSTQRYKTILAIDMPYYRRIFFRTQKLVAYRLDQYVNFSSWRCFGQHAVQIQSLFDFCKFATFDCTLYIIRLLPCHQVNHYLRCGVS